MELLLVPLLLWLLGFIVFCMILRWILGTDKLIYESRRTNALLEELIDQLANEEVPDEPGRDDQPVPLTPAPERPGRPIYEIKHP